jgi:hypothetical protein
MSETHQDTSPVKPRRGSKKSQKEKNTIDHVTESIFKEDYSGLDSNEPLEEEQFISEEDSSKEWALCDWIVICVAGLFCVGFLSVFYFMYSHMMSISYIASHQGISD